MDAGQNLSRVRNGTDPPPPIHEGFSMKGRRGRVEFRGTANVPHYFINDNEVTREEYDAAFPVKEGAPDGHRPGLWPMRMESLAVHPRQVAEANARNIKAGIGTRYEADGMAVVPSAKEKRKLIKLEQDRGIPGLFDKQEGYQT